jgi:hypothetical protein
MKRESLPPQNKKPQETRFVWRVHPCFEGNPLMTAIEVHSRGQAIQYWRFAVPKSSYPARWGSGPAGGRGIASTRLCETGGAGKYSNCDVNWFGAADAVTNTESAYAVFAGSLPEFICFGPAQSPMGPPSQMEVLWPSLMKSGQ